MAHANLYSLETMAMTEKQQGNNWVRRIAGVIRTDKRRMEELREEAGVKESQKEADEKPAKVG